MDARDRNRLSLWRRFGATADQPQAKGDGYVGENDFHICGSMWPSRKGTNAKGPWQVWKVTLQPAQGETRKLVAVPPELLGRVMAIVNGTSGDTPPEPTEEAEGGADDCPF